MDNKNSIFRFLIPSKGYNILFYLAIPIVIMALYLTFIWSPVERTMGEVQKIFYFHVGSAWNAFFAFFVVLVFSILYLVKRKRIYDIIAGVSAEIGVVFTAIVLATGPIWAHSAWNTWWTWEPRLTTTLILFFIYIAYIMIRNMEGEWQKKARLASVFGIIGFINVPIVFMAVRWWETNLHPVVLGDGNEQSGGGLEPSMLFTLLFTVATMTLVYFLFLRKGIYIEQLRLETSKLKAKWQEKEINREAS
ncbi:cytochrome c biogenesis protein [Texcoconibacillus texcoconensis]|uniref:Heme exporter protein C n=1 Tax=Texcoconibacillus texcoconensis TaxID=1095777 RepID=A0A840QTV1_9BACI|nr:cytochrome c biogenesis protein [Texcoconibacillus texcoconensis]MBB5174805.1 heme exporter protein C [Texcoconibacillus texcoconensis]